MTKNCLYRLLLGFRISNVTDKQFEFPGSILHFS